MESISRKEFLRRGFLGALLAIPAGHVAQSMWKEWQIHRETQRCLKRIWSSDLERDLYIYHGIDTKRELQYIIEDAIRRGHDKLIMTDLYGHSV